MNHPDPDCTATRHGTVAAYQRHGCRCDDICAHMRMLWQRSDARRHHPDDWTDIDPHAVEVAADDGHRLPLFPAERRAAVERLAARGWETRQIADRLGVTTRTVQRHKAA